MYEHKHLEENLTERACRVLALECANEEAERLGVIPPPPQLRKYGHLALMPHLPDNVFIKIAVPDIVA